jgi:hypothetical protein
MALTTAEAHSELPQSEAGESPLTFDEAVPKFVDYLEVISKVEKVYAEYSRTVLACAENLAMHNGS